MGLYEIESESSLQILSTVATQILDGANSTWSADTRPASIATRANRTESVTKIFYARAARLLNTDGHFNGCISTPTNHTNYNSREQQESVHISIVMQIPLVKPEIRV